MRLYRIYGWSRLRSEDDIVSTSSPLKWTIASEYSGLPLPSSHPSDRFPKPCSSVTHERSSKSPRTVGRAFRAPTRNGRGVVSPVPSFVILLILLSLSCEMPRVGPVRFSSVSLSRPIESHRYKFRRYSYYRPLFTRERGENKINGSITAVHSNTPTTYLDWTVDTLHFRWKGLSTLTPDVRRGQTHVEEKPDVSQPVLKLNQQLWMHSPL